MKNIDIRLNIFFIVLSTIGLSIYFIYLKGGKYETELFSILLTFLGFTAGSLYSFIKEHKKDLIVAFKCNLTSIRNQDIYISLSYLFRIKIEGDNKYLMVRGNRIRRQYQPVGGVYKRYPSSEGLFNEMNAKGAKIEENNADDLRFYVKGGNVLKIINWFFSRKNREIDVWREFHEELISNGILPQEKFRFIKPEYLHSKHERLITRRGINAKQYLIYDIYTISFTEEQKKALRDLLKESEFTETYAFVNEEDLDKELIYYDNEEYQLGFHAKYLI